MNYLYRLVIALGVMIVLVSNAGAIIVFEQPANFPPSLNGISITSDNTTDSGRNYQSFDNFMLPLDTTIDRASWQFSYLNTTVPNTNPPPVSDTTGWEISIWSDAGGKPAAKLFSEIVTNSGVNESLVGVHDTDVSSGGYPVNVYNYSLEFSQPFLAKADTKYWFSPFSSSPGENNIASLWTPGQNGDRTNYQVHVPSGDEFIRRSDQAFTLSFGQSEPPDVETLALFADAAYDLGGEILIPVGYSEIPLTRFSSEGFAGSAYINTEGDQIVVAIAGTDSIVDWVGPNPTFINLTGSPNQEFREYVQDTVAIVEFLQNHADYESANISLTGHSLGGAIAQLVGDAAGISVVSFNAPGSKQVLGDTELQNALNRLQSQQNPGDITNYRVYGDLVSTVGEQFGETVTFEPPVARTIVDNFPVGTAKSMHIMDIVLERVVSDAPTTTDIGPTALGVAGSVILAGVFGVSVLDITNVVVLAGDAIFLDPGGTDGFSVSVDLGSPNIQSVRFPFLLFDDALFRLETFFDDGFMELGLFEELELYDFGSAGVDMFRFFVLDKGTGLPIYNPEPFTFDVSFVESGIVNGRLTSFSTQSVSEASSVLVLSLGLIVFGLVRMQRANEKNNNLRSSQH